MSELKRIQGFFCKAMSQGWASGNDGKTSALSDKWSMIVYEEDPLFPGLTLVDQWGSDPDTGRPSGNTFIMQGLIPVWVMWYGGSSYLPEDLPILKAALMENYAQGIFMGGRGPEVFRQDGLLYTNGHEGSFAQFRGVDSIIRPIRGETRRGKHGYWGGSLVYLE